MDNHTPEQRTANMKAIRYKDTKIEIILRKELWARGIHYRKNCKDLPGKPDLAFKGKKVAVFCDSEFWHGFHFQENEDKIKTNRDYWIPKIRRNIERDKEVNEHLSKEGYAILRFWGKEIEEDPEGCAEKVLEVLRKRGFKK